MFTRIPDDKLPPDVHRYCDEGRGDDLQRQPPARCPPGEGAGTILIDEVALAFPELKIVMTHLGDPWISETVSMLIKHPNVYAMTSGGAQVRA